MPALRALLLLCWLASPLEAEALTASPSAFRLEDSREGNVLLGDENAEIAAGEVYGTVVLLWGELAVHGQVDEVVILSGRVVFHPTAKVKNALVVMGGSFESKAGAELAPQNVIYRAPGPLWRILQSAGNLWRDHFTWVAKVIGAIVSCLILWALGLGMFWLFPAIKEKTEGRLLKEWPQNLLVGWLAAILVPIFFMLLVISILGIALLPFYMLLLLFAGLVSYLAAALWAGHRLLPPKSSKKINPWGFLLGLMAMQLLWASGLWWAWIPAFFLWTLAWGGLVRSLRQLWR